VDKFLTKLNLLTVCLLIYGDTIKNFEFGGLTAVTSTKIQ